MKRLTSPYSRIQNHMFMHFPLPSEDPMQGAEHCLEEAEGGGDSPKLPGLVVCLYWMVFPGGEVHIYYISIYTYMFLNNIMLHRIR